MSKPLSPVTQKAEVELDENFTAAEIIEAYCKDNIDVAEYFAGLTQVNLYKCTATGYRFFYPYSVIGRSSLYDQLQKQHGYYMVEKWEHTQALEHIKPTDSVLEVGCGNGNFQERLRKKGVTDAVGLDFSDDAIKWAKQKGLTVFQQSIQEYAKLHPNTYDVVCFFQVLEHIDDIHSFVSAAVSALKPNGKLIIAVPNSNPYLYRYDRLHALNLPPHHMGLWDKKALAAIAPHFGLKNLSVQTEVLLPQYRSGFRNAYIKHLEKSKPLQASVVKLIPAFVFKFFLVQSEAAKDGRNLLAVYEKQ